MTHDKETEVAALVIKDLLYLIPKEKQAAVLELAQKAEAAARKEREERGNKFKPMDFKKDFDLTAPEQRYWEDVMQLKARLAYCFIRNIANWHSPENTRRMLFQQQRGVPGSGYLDEYLGGYVKERRTVA